MGSNRNTDDWLNGLNITFWDSVEKARDAHSVSKPILSKMLGKQTDYYFGALMNKRALSFPTAMSMCSILGLTLDEALSGFTDYYSETLYGKFISSLINHRSAGFILTSDKRLINSIYNRIFLLSFLNLSKLKDYREILEDILLLSFDKLENLFNYLISTSGNKISNTVEYYEGLNSQDQVLTSPLHSAEYYQFINLFGDNQFYRIVELSYLPNFHQLFWDGIIKKADIGPSVSVPKLAKLMGIDSNQLQRYLNAAYSDKNQVVLNKAELRIDTAIQMVKRLNVSFSELFSCYYDLDSLFDYNTPGEYKLSEYWSVLFNRCSYYPLLILFYILLLERNDQDINYIRKTFF